MIITTAMETETTAITIHEQDESVQNGIWYTQLCRLGFTTGVGLRRGWNNDYQGEVNIPFGILCNFHFYQLIDDKASKDIHADKLDI